MPDCVDPPDGPPPPRGLRVFILESDPLVAEYLAATFEEAGHVPVGTARKVEGALEAIEAARPDIVVTEVRLRRPMDGIELAQHLRERGGPPAVFLAASSDAATLRRAEAVRPLALLLKPVPIERLLAVVEATAAAPR